MRLVLTLALALLLAGCAGFGSPNRPDPVVNVMANVSQCGLTEAGVHHPRQDDGFSAELKDELAGIRLLPDREALVVALGRQSSAGYSLGLVDARWFGDATLNVSMQAQQPGDDSATAQVVTEPCVIIDVPARGWSQLRVEADLSGFPVAWVRVD